MQNNNFKVIPFDKITPQMLANDLLALKLTVYHLLQQLTNEVYDIDSPEEFETRFDSDFQLMQIAVELDKNALNDPEALRDVKQSTKRLFSITSMLQSLLPPDPSKIQIVKPS